jgi:putative effector of murein hydrolase LrgA (UPF0299 family)
MSSRQKQDSAVILIACLIAGTLIVKVAVLGVIPTTIIALGVFYLIRQASR